MTSRRKQEQNPHPTSNDCRDVPKGGLPDEREQRETTMSPSNINKEPIIALEQSREKRQMLLLWKQQRDTGRRTSLGGTSSSLRFEEPETMEKENEDPRRVLETQLDDIERRANACASRLVGYQQEADTIACRLEQVHCQALQMSSIMEGGLEDQQQQQQQQQQQDPQQRQQKHDSPEEGAAQRQTNNATATKGLTVDRHIPVSQYHCSTSPTSAQRGVVAPRSTDEEVLTLLLDTLLSD